MSGYLGTKAVFLSTTAASVGGDATIGGDLTASGDLKVDTIVNQSGDNDSGLDLSTNDVVAVKTGNTERMRVDSSGNLLVGKTSTAFNTAGFELFGNADKGKFWATRDGGVAAAFNRKSSDGDIALFAKDGSTVGSIGNLATTLYIETNGQGGLGFYSTSVSPRYNGSASDNFIDLGRSSQRYDDVYATNGTIQTSDRNEKQDIASLTATEMLVAARISAMFKTFRWIDKAAENPNARTHTGIIAQDVQQAFTDEGLDAGDYSLFVSTTWDDENGNSQTRMGIRYPELLSFIAAYNEQRFASIETRLAALEAV